MANLQLPLNQDHEGKSRMNNVQAFKLKLRLRDFTSCLCSAAVSAVCFEGRMAGVDATETGNELSQTKFEFTSLILCQSLGLVHVL